MSRMSLSELENHSDFIQRHIGPTVKQQKEMARATSHVEQADDDMNGVRDVLWALINTKEFIVNH